MKIQNKTKYFFLENKPKDECGLFGISNDQNAGNLVALGLHALQHRGQDSTGIVTSDKNNFYAMRFSVKEAFYKSLPSSIQKYCSWHDIELFKN